MHILEGVRAAYKTLQLVPFEEFARDRAVSAINQAGLDGLSKPDLRGIGSTTWMTVYGVVKMLTANVDIHLVSQAVPDVKMTLKLLEASTGISAEYHTSSHSIRHGTKSLSWTIPSDVQGRVGFDPKQILRDFDFHNRLVRRLQGPFAMARFVVQKAGLYLVFAEDDEFLFETTEQGAKDLKLPIQRIDTSKEELRVL